MQKCYLIVGLILTSISIGCVARQPVLNAPGTPTTYQDVNTPGPLASTGIESQDIVSMADAMVRDMLNSPQLLNRATPPRIVIDSQYFSNDSSAPINKDLIMDRIRVGLNRTSQGRLIFLARHQARMVEAERELERDGVVTEGSQGNTKSAYGYDYRMGGRIASLEKLDPSSGLKTAFYQITFELIERGTGAVIWTNLYDFKKAAADDIVYR